MSKGRNRGSETWRVFCAIALPEEVRAGIGKYIAVLRDPSPAERIAWNESNKLHITLKFIGESSPERVAVLQRAASRTVQSFSPFELAIEASGAFPRVAAPRILWLGVTDHSGQLAAIYKVLEQECVNEGFAPDERPFHAHVTIARLRRPREARRLAEMHKVSGFEPMRFPVTELIVMRSELKSSGAHYTAISRHQLSDKRRSRRRSARKRKRRLDTTV